MYVCVDVQNIRIQETLTGCDGCWRAENHPGERVSHLLYQPTGENIQNDTEWIKHEQSVVQKVCKDPL